jgi:anti-sigma factor RsiW
MPDDLLNILSDSNKDIDNQRLMDYLSGKLSGKERHEIERSMADNEFVNDAIEGLQDFRDKKDVQAYVDQLNAALKKNLEHKKLRREKRRIKENPWVLVSILLILILCVTAYFIIHMYLRSPR